MPITYRLAAQGTTAAPGCSTFFFASSSRFRKLCPTRPAKNGACSGFVAARVVQCQMQWREQ